MKFQVQAGHSKKWRVPILLPIFLPAFLGSLALGATQIQINDAILRGLAYLARTQDPAKGYFHRSSPVAFTAAAVQAIENEGHFPGSGSLYSGNVEKGLDYIFTKCYKHDIGQQSKGNPDTNGNGKGIYFEDFGLHLQYQLGIVIPAIVASNTPNRMVTRFL